MIDKWSSYPVHPLSIADTDMHRDGGTIYVVLVDANARRFELCFDNQIDSATAGRLYVGATHPTRAGAQLVSLGGELEGELIDALRQTLDRQLPPSQQRDLLARHSQGDPLPNADIGVARLLLAIARLEELSAGRTAGT